MNTVAPEGWKREAKRMLATRRTTSKAKKQTSFNQLFAHFLPNLAEIESRVRRKEGIQRRTNQLKAIK